jgi:hypothetical protein
MRKTDREYKVAEMSFYELDRLLYKKSKEANDHLFGGILPFINRLMDENEMILKELEYIKCYLQSTDKPLVKPIEDEAVEQKPIEATQKDEQLRVTTPEEVYEEPSEEELEAVKRYLEKEKRDEEKQKKKYTSKLKIKGSY